MMRRSSKKGCTLCKQHEQKNPPQNQRHDAILVLLPQLAKAKCGPCVGTGKKTTGWQNKVDEEANTPSSPRGNSNSRLVALVLLLAWLLGGSYVPKGWPTCASITIGMMQHSAHQHRELTDQKLLLVEHNKKHGSIRVPQQKCDPETWSRARWEFFRVFGSSSATKIFNEREPFT